MDKTPVKLGEDAFAAISAVEGQVLRPELAALITRMRDRGCSNDEIRAALFAEFRTKAAA